MAVAMFGRVMITLAMSMSVAMVTMIWLITNTTAVRMRVTMVPALIGFRMITLATRMAVVVVVTNFALSMFTAAVRMSVVTVAMRMVMMFAGFVLLWTTSTHFVDIYFAVTS